MNLQKELKENVEGLAEVLVDEYKLTEHVNGTIEDAIDKFLYFEVLDYKFKVDINLDLIEAELLVTYGGPNIYATFNREFIKIEGYWSDTYYEKIIKDKLNIFSCIEELYLEKLENKKGV